MPKTHFATDGFYVACGFQTSSVETSYDVLRITCKLCRRTTVYKEARKEYFETITQDRFAPASFMSMTKKVSDWIRKAFKCK